MFNFTAIQTRRKLAELEVRQINFIIKNRAYRYIAAAREDWLHPERDVSKADWADFGGGHLLMPDPRGLHMGGTIFIGHRDGGSSAFDEYGRRPWEPGYQDKLRERRERIALYRFQGEFAVKYGPYRRSRGFEIGRDEPEQDSDDMHAFHLRHATGRKHKLRKLLLHKTRSRDRNKP